MTGPEKRGRVACIGRVYCDLIFTDLPKMPVLGEEVFAGGLVVHPGGGAYITAAYFAALGRPVSLVSTIPGGPFGEAIRPEMTDSGVDLTPCQVASDHAETPQVTVAMVRDGERAFLTHRSGRIAPDLTAVWALPDLVHLHIGELSTLIAHPELVVEARHRGIRVSLDPSWDENALDTPGIDDHLDGIDVLLPNESEAARLDGRVARNGMMPLVVTKLGSQGAQARTNGLSVNCPARPVETVDTTGAGDAFNAGFLDAWLSGETLPACLEAGNRLGAVAVARIGGASKLPSLKPLDTLSI